MTIVINILIGALATVLFFTPPLLFGFFLWNFPTSNTIAVVLFILFILGECFME